MIPDAQTIVSPTVAPMAKQEDHWSAQVLKNTVSAQVPESPSRRPRLGFTNVGYLAT